MASGLIDGILRERAFKNERAVAAARFGLFSLSMLMDTLAYFGIIEYTAVRPAPMTLLMDVLVFVPSAALFFILLRNIYHDLIKFFAITFDFSLIAMMLIFDPTIPRGGQQIYWVVLVASLFPFFLNLLRYSRAGTLYSAFLTVALFTGVSSYYNQGEAENLIPMLLNLIMILLIGYSIVSSSRKMMEEANTKKMMERYLPPQLVGELYKKNASIEPGGEMRKVTVLFSDIRSFTSISESMHPDAVVNLLNDYLSAMTDTVFHHGGTIDKFIGDAIMTVFGAPVQSGDDALRAVLTAVSMKKALGEFNRRHSDLEAPFEIGIGIHTGEVIAGNIGSEKRLDYTVIGDNVNLSSRIESLTKFYKCSILISQSTYDELHKEISEGSVVVREADNVTVKGRSKSIRIYEVMVFDSAEEKESILRLRDDFEKGLALYRSLQFREALDVFSSVQDDFLCGLYAGRCRGFIQNPPPADWDGVYLSETK